MMAYLKLLSGQQLVIKVSNCCEYAYLSESEDTGKIDLTRECISLTEGMTHDGWRMLFQIVRDPHGNIFLLIIDQVSMALASEIHLINEGHSLGELFSIYYDNDFVTVAFE
jgi:hypothetical protein